MAKGAAASEPHVAQAARAALERGGNAVDAVAAGVLVAAAESPSVFLGSLQLLAGGGGAGLLAIDGRTLQPGKSAPRPRGFLPDEPVPAAARVAVPMLPASLATAVATLGASALHHACAPAIAWAKERSPERAALLETFARRGAPALSEDAVASELLAVAGRAARGLLTREDLAAAVPNVARENARSFGSSGVLTAPWSADNSGDGASTHVVAAADARGLVAIACYDAPLEGVKVPALGIVAPYGAEPVMRGRTRVAAGTPRPAAAPIALRAHKGVTDLAFGIASHSAAEESLALIVPVLETAATVAEALHASRGGRLVAIVRTRDAVRVIASA